MSLQKSISAGSGVGPSAFVVSAEDLRPITADNKLVKYADDSCLIIPARNSHTRSAELNTGHKPVT